MKTIFLLLLMIATSFAHAEGTRGGGDSFSIEFVGLGQKIEAYLKEYGSMGLDLQALDKAINEVRVESTNQDLIINGIEKDAINYPLEKRIEFNRIRWADTSDLDKPSLVLHEYLGILGVEDASYKYSKQLLEDFRYQGQPKPDHACVWLKENGDNAPFTPTDKSLDDEYYSIEAGSYNEVSLYLRAGHGVALLEAWVNGKKIADTSYNTLSGQTDNLRLSVLMKNGEFLEAYCDDVDLFVR